MPWRRKDLILNNFKLWKKMIYMYPKKIKKWIGNKLKYEYWKIKNENIFTWKSFFNIFFIFLLIITFIVIKKIIFLSFNFWIFFSKSQQTFICWCIPLSWIPTSSIALTILENMEIHQMYVKITFLNAELEKEIYMEQHQGFVHQSEHHVCNLHKSLYGLK